MPWQCSKCGFGNEEIKICIRCGSKKPFFDDVKIYRQELGGEPSQTSSNISFGIGDFEYLGGGGYTEALLCHKPLKYGISLQFPFGEQYNGPVVFRIVGDTSSGRSILENPDRVPRLFNAINENHDLPRAIKFDLSKQLFQTIVNILNAAPTARWYRSWIKNEEKYQFILKRPSTMVTLTPYLTGLRKATDDELLYYVLTKFIRHRRVLLDVFNDDNAMLPTTTCPFSVDMSDLVTLDASAFFQIFSSVSKEYLFSSSSSSSSSSLFSSSSSSLFSSSSSLGIVEDESTDTEGYRMLCQTFPSRYWAHHDSQRDEFKGGLTLSTWIDIWQHEPKAQKIPKTKSIIISLLKLADAQINESEVITILQRDISTVLDWCETLNTFESHADIKRYVERSL